MRIVPKRVWDISFPCSRKKETLRKRHASIILIVWIQSIIIPLDSPLSSIKNLSNASYPKAVT